MHLVDLRAEYTVDLLGTEVRHPRLSWRIEDAAKQVAYRIRAASSEAALASGNLLWDSGTVASDATFDIAYGGPALTSMQRVWWMVEARGDNGSAQSRPSWFEAGLLSASDWRGDWIEAEDEPAAADRAAGVSWVWGETSLDARPHAFRLDFHAPADVVRAEILIAGKDHLRGVWVNGVKSPLDRHFDWDTYLPFWGTLAPYAGDVKPGRNSVCALVEAETTGFFPVDGGAFAALIRLHRTDGGIERIVGQAFRVMPDAPTGWTEPTFDAGNWPAVVPSTCWAQGDPRPAEPAMLLRTAFQARGPVAAARLYATALGGYEASINGRPVSDAILAPEISVARHHVFYQSYDVTDLIGQGENVLGATVADGWYASAFGWRIERYAFGPAPRRFRAMLRIDYADGSREWVTTGPDWTIATSPILASEIYDGECFDARRVRPGWDTPGSDAEGWAPVKLGKAPDTRLIAQTSPAIKRMARLEPRSIGEPLPGRYVLDFGQNFSGWVRLRARGPAGTTIRLKFAELLNADGTVDQANLRLAKATDTFILAGTGADELFEPRFTYHGFRYVEIQGAHGQVDLEDIQGVVVHTACATSGALSFPDSTLLQRIFDNAMWSQRSNFVAVPTDCPQRDERMGWMGDIQVFLDAAAFNMEVDPFIRRFLLEARAAQREDGAYPIVVPQPLSFPDVVTAGWSEAGIILPWQLWQRYGDTAAIDENWAAMEAWMAHVARANPDHIWRENRGLDLGDWLSVDAVKPADETTPRVLCATAYWAWGAEQMAEMAQASGRDATPYRQLRAAIGEAYAAEFVTGNGVCGNGSQTSQVLSLAFGLVPRDRRAAAAQVLAEEIRSRGMKLSTGFLGTPYLIDVLADAGLWDEVSGLLLQTGYPSWGYMPEHGATTMWERWNGDTGDLSMNSYNHYAFGAVEGFFYRRLAGIAPAAPGFRRIAVRPVWLPAVGRVSARFESPVGLITTSTDGDAQGLNRLHLTVPPNAVAEVELPAGDWCGVPSDLEGPGSEIRFQVGAGSYEFTR